MEGRCRPCCDRENANKSPASYTAYLTLRSSHCRSTRRTARKTRNIFFLPKNSFAVHPIAMTSCKSTRQNLLFESLQHFVRCSCLESRLRTITAYSQSALFDERSRMLIIVSLISKLTWVTKNIYSYYFYQGTVYLITDLKKNVWTNSLDPYKMAHMSHPILI